MADGASQAAPIHIAGLLRNRTWLALAPGAAAAFLLAYWGFGLHDAKLGDLERIERSFNLVRGQGGFSLAKDPWQLVLAQWLIPVVALFTAAKLFLASLRRDLRVAFARRSSNHVIVCGLGDTGRRIVELLRARGERVLVVDLNAESANAQAAESLGAPTIPGDAKTAAILGLAGVRRAKMLVACTGDDTANLEIALSAVAAGTSAFRLGAKLTVVPEMRADWVFQRFASHSGAGLGSEAAEIRILNTAESAGRLLCRAPAFAALATLQGGRGDLAVIGFGDLGRAVAVQAIRTAFALPGHRMRLHVFDARGAAAATAFAALHPGVDGVAELTAVEAKINPAKPESWDEVRTALAQGHFAAVVVCLPDDGEALYAATRAREALDGIGAAATPVFVRVAGRRKLAEVIAGSDGRPWLGARFVPFGDLADLLAAGVSTEDQGDILARACHEAYLETLPAPSDAPSNRPWHSLPELFRRSNRLFADHLEVKLRAAGLRSCPAQTPRPFDLSAQDIETLAAAEHWRWLVERRLAGWRHGATRDDIALRNPAMLDWADLTEETREGNRAVVRRIPAILARAGREIRRARIVMPGEAEDVLSRFDPEGTEHLVLVVDPSDQAERARALRAIAIPNITVRVDQRGRNSGTGAAGLAPEDAERLRARVEGGFDPEPSNRPASSCAPAEPAAS